MFCALQWQVMVSHITSKGFFRLTRKENSKAHYSDVIMGTMASQITSRTIVCSTVYLGTDQRKHQSSASLAFVRGIHQWLVNSPHKGPVTRKMFPFDDVIMENSKAGPILPFFCSVSQMPGAKDLDSLSHKTINHQILISLIAVWLGVKIIISLWNLTGTWATVLLRHLQNFKAIRSWNLKLSIYTSVNWISIGLDNGLLPFQCQAII